MEPLLRTVRLLFTFYRSYILASFVISASLLKVFWMYGYSSFFAIFWLKLLTYGVIYYFINTLKGKELYYYQNLGLSKRFLWAVTISFDFVIYIFLITQLKHLR
jgi:hypothetical protein